MKIFVPPIKCQGIKTKLVPWIFGHIGEITGQYIEPFMGSGVVGFNIRPKNAIFNDLNPHIINFYNAIKHKEITAKSIRIYLEYEGMRLKNKKDDHYYFIRERFNEKYDPIDFLFLSRSCFNGMIRFNKSGRFNVPFCHKPERFSKSYITKIVNQVEYVEYAIQHYNWIFTNNDFSDIIPIADIDDFIYCDPPYIDRHVDYFNSWDDKNELLLFEKLSETKSKFLLSTWHSNKYRENQYIHTLWDNFNYDLREHFYHVGAKELNRNSMKEALVFNYKSPSEKKLQYNIMEKEKQLALFESEVKYGI